MRSLATRSTVYFIAKIKRMETAIQTRKEIEAKGLVEVRNGKVVTTSLEVAKYFGKEHKVVLKSIRELDCSLEFQRHNFMPLFYISELHGGGKMKQPMYYLTRDGFTFLAMGFTGKVAARFKEAYIEAFNKMEAALREGEAGAAGLALSLEINDFVRRMNTYVEHKRREDPKFMLGNEAQPGFFDNPNQSFETRLHNVFMQVGNAYRECWAYIREERRWREKCRYMEDCFDDMCDRMSRRSLEKF